MCNSNQSENKRASRLHHNQVGESKLISVVRDKWKQYECEERSSDRRSTLKEELGSIQALLARQRARTSTSHTYCKNKSAIEQESRYLSCAQHTNSLQTIVPKTTETNPTFGAAAIFGNNDDLSSLDLPPLTVTFKSRTSFKTIHASSA